MPDRAAQPGLTEPQKGVAFALMAHVLWGGLAYYISLLANVLPWEIATQRGLWSVPVAAFFVWLFGQFGDVARAFRNPRLILTLVATTALIVFNWTFYIWSVDHDRTLEATLGYYINPLINILGGFLFLGERFTRAQLIAIALAVVAVLLQTYASGTFPLLGLLLGLSFSTYGLLRKTAAIGPTQGFFIETLFMAGPMLLAQYFMHRHGLTHFGQDLRTTALLIGSGPFTAGALLLFSFALPRLRYSTVGVMQYISPSLVFLTAVFIFGEPMNQLKFLSFVILWTALAIYSVSAIREDRARLRAAAAG